MVKGSKRVKSRITTYTFKHKGTDSPPPADNWASSTKAQVLDWFGELLFELLQLAGFRIIELIIKPVAALIKTTMSSYA